MLATTTVVVLATTVQYKKLLQTLQTFGKKNTTATVNPLPQGCSRVGDYKCCRIGDYNEHRRKARGGGDAVRRWNALPLRQWDVPRDGVPVHPASRRQRTR